MNNRFDCLKNHTLATIGAQCGALIFNLSESERVPDLFNIVNPYGYWDVNIGFM